MNLKVSKKYIINIHEFMYNFLDTSYTAKNRLTHKEMKRFLYEKNKFIPKRVRFNKIKKEDILRGKCLLVEDVNSKIIAYDNPQKLEELLEELLSQQNQKHQNNQKTDFIPKQKKLTNNNKNL